jgi:nitroreductase
MQLILALQGWGVGSCWVAGAKKDYAEDVRKLLNVPEDYTLVSLVPAGYPEEISIAKKKPLDEVAFFDRYEEEK